MAGEGDRRTCLLPFSSSRFTINIETLGILRTLSFVKSLKGQTDLKVAKGQRGEIASKRAAEPKFYSTRGRFDLCKLVRFNLSLFQIKCWLPWLVGSWWVALACFCIVCRAVNKPRESLLGFAIIIRL